jgi:serine/threonine protein kinase
MHERLRSPRLVADLLLFSVLETDASLLDVVPGFGFAHQVSVVLARGPISCWELDSNLADAAIARVALLSGLDFTSGEERNGRIRLACRGVQHELSVSVRALSGHLALELRRPRVISRKLRPGVHKPEFVGDYVLRNELGRGALGTVYRAEHRLLGRPAAIKIWSLPDTALARANAALFREARAAAATKHPGVVEVHDLLVLDDGRAAVIMELLEGETLTMRLHRERSFAPLTAVKLARRVAEVLEATSARGIVHRDIKPENIFLLADGRLKLLDFGAALHEQGNERAGTLGTPWYMAPEQAYGGAPDRRSDIYSLGCVLFELISGQCPFDDTDPDAVMRMHRDLPVPLLSSRHGPIPEALQRTVSRALEKTPERRQQSASELLLELQQIEEALTRPGFRRWLPP